MLASIPKLNIYLVRICALSKLDNFFDLHKIFFNFFDFSTLPCVYFQKNMVSILVQFFHRTLILAYCDRLKI